MTREEEYMAQAIELASKGWGLVSPNPMVGAVVVKDGTVIGMGFHKGPGTDHAEVAALKEAGIEAHGASLFVNLEPCSHFGTTPPCTEAIINSGIKKVFFGLIDPNPLVNGRGIKRLSEAGIEVTGPIMEKESRSLNRIYINWMEKKTPYVIAKIALSLDGKVALKNGKSRWITNDKTRQRMHYWRSGVDAVLVGAGTIRKDNPILTARLPYVQRQPKRIVVTASGNIPTSSKVFEEGGETIIIAPKSNPPTHLKEFAEIMLIEGDGDRLGMRDIIHTLGEKGITSLLVEGGTSIHQQLFKEELVRYAVASISTKLIGSLGQEWLPAWNIGEMDAVPRVVPDQILVINNDIVIEGEVNYVHRDS